MAQTKKEASTVAGSLKGFLAPFGASVIRRKGKKKNNPSKPYGEPELFEAAIAKAVLDDKKIDEVVVKKGTSWLVIDDETGAQVGSYKDRETAWEKQRQRRKSKLKQEALEKIKNNLKKAINERSVVSYVFEQPVVHDSLAWEAFLEKLSPQIVMSDGKLKGILQNIAKAEAKLLGSAMNLTCGALKSNGVMTEQGEVDQDEEGNLMMNFSVGLGDEGGGKKVPFLLKLQNGRPLIHFPDDAKNALNMMDPKLSKLLRAELMHAQETVLNKMDDVVKVTEKRDTYLRNVEGKMDKILQSMNPLQLAIFRHLLKNKYKGVK